MRSILGMTWLYILHMEKRIDHTALATKSGKMETSQDHLEDSLWNIKASPSTTAPIAKGATTPPCDGRAVTRILIQYA